VAVPLLGLAKLFVETLGVHLRVARRSVQILHMLHVLLRDDVRLLLRLLR
jgi:hypothetical protein